VGRAYADSDKRVTDVNTALTKTERGQ